MNTKKIQNWTALDSAVVEQLGYNKPIVNGDSVTIEDEAAEDLANVSQSYCGAAGGFGGFVYYWDTWKFFRKNRDLIRASIQDMADGCGDGCAIDCILGFNCYRDQRKDSRLTSQEVITADDVGRVLYGELPEQWGEQKNADGEWVSGGDVDPFCVANSCAFFALEETANKWVDGDTVEA